MITATDQTATQLHPSVAHALDPRRRRNGPLHARYRAATGKEWPSYTYHYGTVNLTGEGSFERFLSVCPDGMSLVSIVTRDEERARLEALKPDQIKLYMLNLLHVVLAAVPAEYRRYNWNIRLSPYVNWHLHVPIDRRAAPYILTDVPGLDVDCRPTDDPLRTVKYAKKPGARKQQHITPAYVDEMDALAEMQLEWREYFKSLGRPQPRMSGYVGIPTWQAWRKAAKAAQEAAVAAEVERLAQLERERVERMAIALLEAQERRTIRSAVFMEALRLIVAQKRPGEAPDPHQERREEKARGVAPPA